MTDQIFVGLLNPWDASSVGFPRFKKWLKKRRGGILKRIPPQAQCAWLADLLFARGTQLILNPRQNKLQSNACSTHLTSTHPTAMLVQCRAFCSQCRPVAHTEFLASCHQQRGHLLASLQATRPSASIPKPLHSLSSCHLLAGHLCIHTRSPAFFLFFVQRQRQIVCKYVLK